MEYKISKIRKADLEDVKHIYSLINKERFKIKKGKFSGFLLPLSVKQIEKEVKNGNFFVVVDDDAVVGCVSVIEYDGIIELRSLVVHKSYRKKGYGSLLIDEAKDEAKVRGYDILYTLTQTPTVFKKYGFMEGGRPIQKIAKDCETCPFYNNCIEITMVARLN